jgi:hypothetical protein
LFKWYDLSGYREVEGIKLPLVIVEDDRIKKDTEKVNSEYQAAIAECYKI